MIGLRNKDFLILNILIAYGIVGSTAAILLYLLVLGGSTQLSKNLNFSKTQFNFQVYCPVNSQETLLSYIHSFGSDMKLLQNINLSSLYIVFMEIKSLKDLNMNFKEVSHQQQQQKGAQMHYCGLTRQWNGTCQNAKLICSSPGPMFYLPINQQITIIWINNINNQRLQYWIQQGCYNYQANDYQCKLDAKYKNNNNLVQCCTFNKPTNYGYPYGKVTVNKSQIPVAPYIHGLQTRPAFTGNPLSWFNNKGDVGVGYFSLDKIHYFNQFKKIEYNTIAVHNKNFPMKIIKAYNKQMPGTLLYYDNSIKAAKQNVAAGLSGLYILVNQSSSSVLPHGLQQKFIYFSHLLKFSSLSKQIPYEQRKRQNTIQDVIYTLNNDIYYRNMTYRFRIINGHINNHYHNISFAVFSSSGYDQNLDNSFQVDPQTISYSLDFYMKIINFTIIGSDSTLFNQPIHNVRSIDLGISQRLDILIQFDEKNGVSKHIQNFYLVIFNQKTKSYEIKTKFKISRQYKQNKCQGMNEIKSISVPYCSLASKGVQQIQIHRMKFIWNLVDQSLTSINGNYKMNQGQTEKSKIGTIQNWYLINNNQISYPFHLGFLNFQIVQSYTLKQTRQGCTYYELDFFRMLKSSFSDDISNKYLCYYIRNMTIQDSKAIFQDISRLNIQEKATNTFIGKVTGLNVMQKITQLSDQKKYGQISNENPCKSKNLYKYLCDQAFQSIPQWNKRWKDTTIIDNYTVTVIRIRWASTTYDQKAEKYPYFSIPEEQAIEFPGYFYQGGSLPGKNIENIRPFMLQYSDVYLRDKILLNTHPVSAFNNNIFTWQSKAMSINANLQCFN